MAKLQFLKVILPVSVGFGLNAMARSVGVRGDLAALQGDRAGALSGHLAGLLLVIAALMCFGYALLQIFRGVRGGGGRGASLVEAEPMAARIVDMPAKSPDSEPFDPDAVMARYMAQRQATAAPPAMAADVQPVAVRPAFGRKRA